jgi:trans-aconitate methyltransferase
MDTKDIKQFYDGKMPEKFSGSYEQKRWASSPILKAQFTMTRDTLRHHLPQDKSSKRVLELGCGPGTWTKELLRIDPLAHIDVVDISHEMLEQARVMLKDKGMISFYESDFLAFRVSQKYDLFFSSRALEYFPDKVPVVAKIYGALAPGKSAFLITKMPHKRGRKLGKMHEAQVHYKELRKIFYDAGFVKVKMYPATINIPLIRSPFLSRILFNIVGRLPVSPFSAFFSESYCIVATKA